MKKKIIFSAILVFVTLSIIIIYPRIGGTVYSNEKYGYTISIPYSYKVVTYGEWGSQDYLREIPARADSYQVDIYRQDALNRAEDDGISIREMREVVGAITPKSICPSFSCGEDFRFEALELGGGKGLKRIAPTGHIRYFLQKDDNSPILVISIGYGLNEHQDKILSTFKFDK